jgi:hypothetical protein
MATLVLLPLLLFGATAQASVLYRCRVDGQARRACCCPPVRKAPPAGPTISRGSCCDTEASARAEASPAVAGVDERAAVVAMATPIDVAVGMVAPPPVASRRTRSVAQAPPPPRPSLLLVKSSRLL